ncbi:unnamed protein product [Arctogadus glacialis]
MKLRKQVTVCGGAIFCVAVFSLYLMLDRVQHDPARRQNGGNFPRSQISVLQNRIEQLEQLLEENHQIISHIKDSVMELTDTGAVSPSGHLPFRSANGSWVMPFDGRPSFVAVKSQDCQVAVDNHGQSDLQMLDVYSLLKFDNPDGGVWKQGFDITYEPEEWDKEPLQVFVVPHSHNDPGWIKTFDKYFLEQTQHILNNMVLKLGEDPRRRFIWSEISYFSKWWEGADKQKREVTRKLVKSGQLEIVTGGWVMTDEANAHYFAMLDQLIEGHQWLETNLGVKPQSGWAIDPFGHSATMAYLLKKANLTSMLIQRVHYSIKKHFASTRSLEFMWRQSWDKSSDSDIFCHMMPFYSYDVPHTCGPDPKVCCQFDFKRLPGGRVNCPWKVPPKAVVEANVEERANLLLDQYRKKSKLFRSKVLLVPLGDDFRYDMALEWDQQFSNYQRLFDYMNAHPQMHVKAQFGTLSEYFSAVYKAGGVAQGARPADFPVLSGDFFAYADREDHYWTGYFTSRPFYKSLDRVLESHLRGAEILYSLALGHARHAAMEGRYPVADYALLVEARRTVALFQHHDAITGTAKENVVVDYGARLLRSLIGLKRVIINAAHFLVMKNKEFYRFYQTEPFLETDDRRATQDSLPQKTLIELDSTGPRYLVLYNPVEQERLCALSTAVDIRDQTNKELAMRLVTDIQSGDVFHTDLNGFQMQARRQFLKLPLQANFYPMPSQALIQDSQHRLSLHSAQALGVASLESGQLEVILDRRLMQDDNRGLGQGLKDNKKTVNRFRLLLERRDTGNASRLLAKLVAMFRSLLPLALRRGGASEVDGNTSSPYVCLLYVLGTLLISSASSPPPATPSLPPLEMTDSGAPAFPSLLGHLTGAVLNHEVLALPVLPKKRGVPQLQTFCPLREPLPCDFHLVNLRSVVSQEDPNSPSPYTAMILHRKGMDCSLESPSLGFNCSTTQGQLGVSGLLRGLDLQLLQPVSLTLMHSAPPLANDSSVSLNPMELSAFKLKLR